MTCKGLILFSFWLLLIATVAGQIRSGSIVGAVGDKSGAAVAGAQVKITFEQTNQSFSTTTNESGEFGVPYLQFGKYTLEVSKEGFNAARVTGIDVATAETIRVPVTLVVGSLATRVEVTADSLNLEVESASMGGVTGQGIIDTVPNINNNPFYYATLQAGVISRAETNDSQTTNSFGIGIDGRRTFSAISVNGGTAFSNDILVDGVSVQGSAWNEAAVIPNPDSVQEVRVITNNFSAEYGRAQGVLQLTTKSGTNQYHGTLSDQIRNDFFNANTFSNNARNIPRPEFKVNTYAGTLGGRVPKTTSLFFFVSYEGLTHNQTVDYLRSVPTAAQRIGDFSQTRTTISGAPVPLQVFDPYSSVLTGQNVYTRTPFPNAVIPNPDPNALKLMSYFPLPNRTPDDQFGTNNYDYRPVRTFGKNSVNSRLDYHRGKHSFYGTGGITRGTITTPSSWGPGNPFFGRNTSDTTGNNVSDNNPYGALGDTIVLSPTMVVDLRYGINRIESNNQAAIYPNFDYSQFGISSALQAINAVPGAAPEFYPGGTISPLNQTNSVHKRERQTNHQLVGSLTKNLGRWIFKWGSEYRVFLSNYTDAEEAFWIQTSAEYTRQLTNATGGAIGSPNNDVAGFGPASILSGAGFISVAAGRDVKPAFAQKYFALYSQSDWRATNRLTVFLGLRWDLQPAPTERYNRMSSFDFSAKNPYGTNGVYAFSGAGGYSRNLWDTHYKDFGPRLGFGYKLSDRSVLRGGYGISYLPTNTGYFDGPFAYGEDTFSAYTASDVYGPSPSGVPVGTYYQVNRIVNGTGADPTFPAIYGGGQLPRFDRIGYRDGTVQQWNLSLETRFGRDWQVSASYAGNKGQHLPFARFPLNSNQFLPASLLNSWHDNYVARNGTGYTGSDQVANPFQPANGPLIPFLGNEGHATLSLQEALQPWALFGNLTVQRAMGYSRYDSLVLQVNRRFANGLLFNAHYTWSRASDFTQTESQNNGFADTGGYEGTNIDLLNYKNDKKLSLTDVPHRFVVSAVYDLPFGVGKALAPSNRLARAVVSGWKTGGVFTWQSGFPIFVSGANNGALNGRPNLVPGQPLEVPQALQHWYDGKTRVTLPDGRIIQPPAFTFLKYNPDAFGGQVTTAANGSLIADQLWWGASALDYSGLRDNGRVNFDLTLRRTFRVTERVALDFSAQASNVLNHAEFRPDTNGALGATNVGVGGPSNLVPGQPQSASFGTYGNATFDPRQVTFAMKLRF
jgi:hypothetical protein